MNQSSCVFCKIASGAIESTKLFEDGDIFVIRDLHPQAKHHFLVIPKLHLPSLVEAYPESGADHSELVGRLFEVATKIAREEGLLPAGFRSVINTGSGGGQSVFHLHLHVLGGEPLSGSFG